MRILVLILCALPFAPSTASAQQDKDSSSMRSILERCRTLLLREGGAGPEDLRKCTETLSKDGSWPDVDCLDRNPSGWKTAEHLSRMRTMALAFACNRDSKKKDAELRGAVTASMDHWLAKRYRSPNWWWNEIGVPRAMRDIVVLLGDDLKGVRRTGAIEVIGQHKLRGTGANLMWSAELSLHHGCLTHNSLQVAKAADRLRKEITVGARQGIQPDWSFFQHGPRLQAFHYGRSYLDVVCRIGWQLQQTRWEIPKSRRDIISQYILEGLQWMCRGKHTVPGTIDRAVSRRGSLCVEGLAAPVQFWQEVDIGRKDDLEAFLNRLRGTSPPLSGYRHFPHADFSVYHRPEGSFFLKTLSTRTLPTESINNENLKGVAYLHCGDHYVLQDGSEYSGLQPLWIWSRMPGLTLPQGTSKQKRRDFVGGIGNGSSGLTAMDFVRTMNGKALKVRKLWACQGNLVVCLLGGWEITEPMGDITTSVEQCRVRGQVSGPQHGNARWILSGRTGYMALGEASLEVRLRRASGSWHEINRQYGQQEVTGEILLVTLCHGSDPRPAGFAIVLGTDKDHLSGLASVPEWQVLRNDRQCQCIRFGNGLHMGAFYAPAGIDTAQGLQVDKPCLAMWSADGLWLCDPTHHGTAISVKWLERVRKIVLPPAAGIIRIAPVDEGDRQR